MRGTRLGCSCVSFRVGSACADSGTRRSRPVPGDRTRGLRGLCSRPSWVHSLWGEPIRLEHVCNFEGLGFDMTAFEMADGIHGEIAYGTTANFMTLHGGPHDVLVDKAGVLTGVTFPLL